MKHAFIALAMMGLFCDSILAAPPQKKATKVAAKKPRKAKPKPAPLKGPWPPKFQGTNDDTVTLTSKRFLQIPESVAKSRGEEGMAPFVMAKTPPTVDMAYHRDLGPDAINRRTWSS